MKKTKIKRGKGKLTVITTNLSVVGSGPICAPERKQEYRKVVQYAILATLSEK